MNLHFNMEGSYITESDRVVGEEIETEMEEFTTASS